MFWPITSQITMYVFIDVLWCFYQTIHLNGNGVADVFSI